MRRNSSAEPESGLRQAGRQKASGGQERLEQERLEQERRKGHPCEKANVSELLCRALGTYVLPTSTAPAAIKMKSNPSASKPETETHTRRRACMSGHWSQLCGVNGATVW